MRCYILNATGEPEPCDDMITWAHWMAEHHDQRLLAKDRDEGPDAPAIEVSTVFTGVDARVFDGPPLLWETMIFGGPLDLRRWKYDSREAALVGHRAACRELTAALTVRQEQES